MTCKYNKNIYTFLYSLKKHIIHSLLLALLQMLSCAIQRIHLTRIDLVTVAAAKKNFPPSMLLFINAKLSIHVPGSSNSYRTDKAQPQRGELTLYNKYVLDLMMSINLLENKFIIKLNDDD